MIFIKLYVATGVFFVAFIIAIEIFKNRSQAKFDREHFIGPFLVLLMFLLSPLAWPILAYIIGRDFAWNLKRKKRLKSEQGEDCESC